MRELLGFIGSHKSVFKESKVACRAVVGEARYPSGLPTSHCMSRALRSYRQDMIAAECEHKALHPAWKSPPASHRDTLSAALPNI